VDIVISNYIETIPSWSISSSKHLSLRTTLLQLGQNLGLQALRLSGACPPSYNLSVASDEEFLEVPLDALHAHETWLLLLHPLPDWLRFVAVDVDFAEHGERDTVVHLAEGLNLVVCARVLASELVRGEAYDLEVCRGFISVSAFNM
jgi:hypothetical protein